MTTVMDDPRSVLARATCLHDRAAIEAALMRMADAGAEMGNWFAFACEMLNDWRNPEGAGSAGLFAEHMPGYAEAMASHSAFTGDKSGKVE